MFGFQVFGFVESWGCFPYTSRVTGTRRVEIDAPVATSVQLITVEVRVTRTHGTHGPTLTSRIRVLMIRFSITMGVMLERH